MLDELEMVRHDAGLTAEERDRAVDEFSSWSRAVDGILQAQTVADAGYFAVNCGRVVEHERSAGDRGRLSRRPTAGNTSIQAPGTRISSRCCPA